MCIETAARVLNQHGYAGSGMSELMTETGLAKGGIYRHFDSKEALAVEAFNFAFATVLNSVSAILNSVPNAVDKLVKYVEGYATVESPIPGGVRFSIPESRMTMAIPRFSSARTTPLTRWYEGSRRSFGMGRSGRRYAAEIVPENWRSSSIRHWRAEFLRAGCRGHDSG